MKQEAGCTCKLCTTTDQFTRIVETVPSKKDRVWMEAFYEKHCMKMAEYEFDSVELQALVIKHGGLGLSEAISIINREKNK